MKDLSREERLEQDILRLEKRISEISKESRKNKWLRIKITFLILSGVVYFIALEGDIINNTSGLFWWLIIAPLMAIAVMVISYLVLAYIINGVMKDVFAIGKMEGRLSEIQFNKYDNCEKE